MNVCMYHVKCLNLCMYHVKCLKTENAHDFQPAKRAAPLID